LYENRVYELTKPLPADGQPVSIDNLLKGGSTIKDRFLNPAVLTPPPEEMERARIGAEQRVAPRFDPNRGMVVNPPTFVPPYELVKRMLLFRAFDQKEYSNSGARTLDQFWRMQTQFSNGVTVPPRDEVILIGRIGPKDGPADEVMAKGFTPTAL